MVIFADLRRWRGSVAFFAMISWKSGGEHSDILVFFVFRRPVAPLSWKEEFFQQITQITGMRSQVGAVFPKRYKIIVVQQPYNARGSRSFRLQYQKFSFRVNKTATADDFHLDPA